MPCCNCGPQQIVVDDVPALRDFTELRKIMFRTVRDKEGEKSKTYQELVCKFKLQIWQEYPNVTHCQVTEAVTLYFMKLAMADVSEGYVESIP